MLISTTENIDRNYEVVGTVFGIVTKSRNVGSDVGAQVKNFFGGEIKGYTKMLQSAREESMIRLEQNAKDLNADAIVMVRFNADTIGNDIQAVTTYGTAVKFTD